MTRIALLLVAILLAAAACSGDDDDGSTSAAPGELTIMVDSSAADVLGQLAPDANLVVASSNELRSRIEDGEAADVYAVAGPDFSAGLDQDAVIEPAEVFATNRLVLAVPAGNPAGIESVGDLGPGVTLATAAPESSLGAYTRSALEAVDSAGVLDGATATAQDGRGVLDQLAAGEADAGFVFFTDAKAAGDAVETIELPAQALLQYTIAPVITSERIDEAKDFVQLVLGDEGQQALEAAGFGVHQGAPR